MLVGRLESRWGLVLAGGEGKRCRTYWRARYDDGRPKQFCSLGSERTLLQETLDRANLYAPPSRTVLSICECHQRWRAQWEGRGLQVTAEPRGADTGPAVIQATHFIHRKCASAVVVLFPSDHAISDDVGFIAAVNRAATWVQRHRDRIIALAVPARGPETGYGWLLPDGHVEADGQYTRPGRLIEKPDESSARRLFQAGAYWNTFVLVYRASHLLGVCELLERKWTRAIRDATERTDLERAYAENAPFSLSASVLQRAGKCLRMLPVPDVHWSDLGTPEQIERERSRLNLSQASPQPDAGMRIT